MSPKEIVILLSALIVVFGVGVEGKPGKDSNLETSPYFWKIKSSPPSYLLGTIHMPYVLMLDSLSEDVLMALRSANQVYMEVEDKNATCPSLRLPAGQTLAQVRHFTQHKVCICMYPLLTLSRYHTDV